jgi:hypothetical protein
MSNVGATMRPIFFAVALTMVALGATGVHADNSEACKKAVAVLGKKKAKAFSQAECQQALDSSEEEQWQLWLDMAAADEQAANPEKAIATLARFVDAADRREDKLAPNWARVRDESRTTLARLDGELLKKKARVTFKVVPEGASVTFPKGVQGTPEKTPVIKYFAPGEHVARVFDDASQKAREVTFSVEKGQRVVLKVDLLTDAPSGAGVLESEGPAVVGQSGKVGDPGAGEPGAGGPDGGPNTILEKDLDTEAPPLPAPPNMWDRIGAASLGLGVAGLTAGAVFLADGLRLDDNAACSGDACLFDQAQRSKIKSDAQVAKDRGIAGFIIGAVFVAGGITALLLPGDDAPTATGPQPRPKEGPGAPDGKAEKSDKTGLRAVTPWFGAEGGGVAASFAF